jgi:SAM-dependent methyltransferase
VSTQQLAATAAAYDAAAVRYTQFVAGELGTHPLDTAVLAAFAEHVRAAGPGLTADLGCGPGRIGAHLAGLGLDVLGLDVAPAMTTIARAACPGLRVVTASVHALPLPDASLAGAVAWYSVIHAAPGELPGYLAECARVVRPGGYLLAAVFEGDGGAPAVFDHQVAPAYRWPLGELAALAGAAGLAEVGRVSREPGPAERFRHGRLLLRRR